MTSSPKVVIVFNAYEPRPTATGARLSEESVAEMARQAHDAIRSVGIDPSLVPHQRSHLNFLRRVRELNTYALDNLCEGYFGRPQWESNVAGIFELLGLTFTGNAATTLAFCQDKLGVALGELIQGETEPVAVKQPHQGRLEGLGLFSGGFPAERIGPGAVDVADHRQGAAARVGQQALRQCGQEVVGSDPGRRLDWLGFLALALGIGALQMMLDRGERLDWFESDEIVLLAWISGLSLYVFIVHTFTAREPFLDPHLIANRKFFITLLLISYYGLLSVPPMVLMPPFLESLRGYELDAVGLLQMPRGVLRICFHFPF